MANGRPVENIFPQGTVPLLRGNEENPNISKEIGLRMVLASGLGRPWQFCHPAAKQIKIILRLS